MAELFEKLGINWQLLVANMVTFFIVLGLLAKFAYKPLMQVMDRRRSVIDQSLKDAEAIKDERDSLAKFKVETLHQARQEALHIVQVAKKDAEATRAEVIAQTQSEALALMERTKTALAQEQRAMLDEAKGKLADMVVTATGTILRKDSKVFTTAMSKEASDTLQGMQS